MRPHSWTVDRDVAVAELVMTDDDDAWGRAWHVPTDAPATLAELCRLAADVGGVESPEPTSLPRAVVTLGGTVVPVLHALWETRHQFERPFVLDSSAAQRRFGLSPTPLRAALEQTVAALRGQEVSVDH